MKLIESDLGKLWEEHIRALPGIKQAAVIAHEESEPPALLHLSDLLPDWKAGKSSTEIQIGTTKSEQPVGPGESKVDSNDPKDSGLCVRLSQSAGPPIALEADSPRTLPEALLRAVKVSPDKGMVYVQSDGTELTQTYLSLLEDAERILGGLRSLNVTPGDKVLFQLEHNQDFIPAFWGCVLGGFVPVPISIAPTYDQVNSTINKLHNAWVMLDKPVILTGEGLEKSVRSLSSLLKISDMRVATVEQMRGFDRDSAHYDSKPDDMAIMLLTSGSTGTPKGVTQRHSSLLCRSAATAQHNHFSEADVSLNWFPLDHVGGIVMFHVRDVWLQCTQVHAPTQFVLTDPLKWLDMVQSHKVTVTWAPNFAYGLVNALEEEVARRKWDLSSLRFILNAGEAIVARTARRFVELLIPHGLPPTAMHPAWGMSETSSAVTYSHIFTLDNTSDNDSFVEVGSPIPGFSVRIVGEKGELVEEGKTGRLEVMGPTVTTGYYNNPEINREAFTEDGWFNTGDLGKLRDGCLTITGRQKDVIIINGVNFYSHEIESVVEEIEGIEVSFTAACAVRGTGGDTDELAIFFHTREKRQIQLNKLLKEIRGQVVRNVGVNPSYLIPIEKSGIPKTEIGKIQRTQLRIRFEAGEFDDILKEVDILLGGANTIPDWFYHAVWRPKEIATIATGQLQSNSAAPHGSRTLVFADNLGLADQVCANRKAVGSFTTSTDMPPRDVVRVDQGLEFCRLSSDHYRIDPANQSHYRMLLESVREHGGLVDEIVHLWTYDKYQGEPSNVDAVEPALESGLYSMLYLFQALGDVQGQEHPVRLLAVSSYAQATGPKDLIACERATVLGLVRAVGHEMSYVTCSHLDLEIPCEPEPKSPPQNAKYVLQELFQSDDREVSYRAGHRLVMRLERADLVREPKQGLQFKQGGFYLLTGGLGGIGVQIAKNLLNHYGARLLLIGRTPLSGANDDFRSREFRALQSLGGQVKYETVDVCDLEKLRAAVTKAEAEWGCQLDGILHLAGLYHDRLLTDETRESFSSSIRPKVQGSWTLAQLVKERPHSTFIGFSSALAYFSGAMIGSYTAGNCYLESICHDLSFAGGFQSFCYRWSTWDETGMSAGYENKAPLRNRGFMDIPPEQGIQSLLAGLYAGQTNLLIGLDGGSEYIRRNLEFPDSASRTKRLHYYGCFTTNGSEPALDTTALNSLERTVPFGEDSVCELVRLEDMPSTDDGVIDRTRLADLVWNRGTSESVAPRSKVERQLADIWQDVLGVANVGVFDNFFELGGHSLLATQVISRIRSIFHVELSLPALFQAPTVAGLASCIGSGGMTEGVPGRPAIQPAPRNGELPLSFAQQRLWFIDQYEPGNPVYNIPAVFRVVGDLSINALEVSLQAIVRRHEALRTTFQDVAGRPIQVITDDYRFRIAIVDATGGQKTEEDLRNDIIREVRAPFDLATGPLVRAMLLRMAEREHILVITTHHIISDGWSVALFNKELSSFYDRFSGHSQSNGEITSKLPELPIQYPDYAVWQREWLQGEAMNRQVAYWQKHLAGAPVVLNLPTDFVRPAGQTFRGARLYFQLPTDLVKAAEIIGQAEGITLYMTMLAAFGVMLKSMTNQNDILVGSPIANRTQSETEALLGFFANTLVHRLDMRQNPTFRELLGQVRDDILRAYEHQDLPFEKIVEALRPPRDPSRNPLFQVNFRALPAPAPLALAGLDVETIDFDSGISRFDMSIELAIADREAKGFVEYTTDLFNEATADRFRDNYISVLRQALGKPDIRVLEIVA